MNTVTVKINGMEYNLKGKENEEYLFEVAKYVDDKFREISANNSKLSTTSVAVLSALNIADQYFKCDLEISDISKKKNSLEERYLTLKERLREVKTESDEVNKAKSLEIEALKNIIYSMEDKIKEVDTLVSKIEDLETKLKENEDNYKMDIEKLNKEIDNKDNDLKVLASQNEELQEKENELAKAIEIKSTEAQKSNVYSQEVSALKNELNNINKEKETLRKANKDLKFKLQNSKYKILDLEKKLLDANFDLAVEKKVKNPLLR